MARATTLNELQKVLDPRPLVFSKDSTDQAANRDFHVPLPEETRGPFKVPGPIAQLEQKLLSGTRETKVFLSGHIGSGKSTELNRLMEKPEIVQRFTVVPLRFEEQEWAILDSSQVLFRIAGALYDAHKDKLGALGDGLKKKLKLLDERIYGKSGIDVGDGSASLEVNAFMFKVRKDVKLSEKVRRQFREFGETNQSFLQDLLSEIVEGIEAALALDPVARHELLVIVDDLDKLRTPEQHADIFDKNLGALLSPPLRILYTVPTAVRFADDVRAEIRHNSEILFPIRVLRKSPELWDPEKAFIDERIDFFNHIVEQRADVSLIDRDAIRLAAIYAGGVLRQFFRLLRAGVVLAMYNRLPKVDGMVMRYAVDEDRRKESVGMYESDYDALLHVHQTNTLRNADDQRYLALSRVIEAFNGTVWFEANPVFWSVLEDHAISVKARRA